MADGVVGGDAARGATTLNADADGGGLWFFRTRQRMLASWAAVAFVLVGSIVAYAFLASDSLVKSDDDWSYLLAASNLFWLPVVLLLLDPAESLANGPRLRLPAATFMVLSALTIVAVIDAISGRMLLATSARKVLFFSFLALAFIPRIWNAAIFALHKKRNRQAAERAALIEQQANSATGAPVESIEQDLHEYRNAESLGALFATIVVILIVSGAFWIGSLGPDPKLGASLGVAIFVTVIAIFATIVFLDWISRFRPLRVAMRGLRAFAPRTRFLADFYDWIDAGLVRIGSHVAGADHTKTRTRYSVLGGTLICLSLLGWFLPTPFGLIPVAIGLLTALSLSRLWSWVEEDRNLASMTQFNPLAPQKIGFREDYRDETLLGFIFVLLLIPIGMMQAHEGNLLGGPLFQLADNSRMAVPNGAGLDVWLGYFGFELAKALPIVDWADIYHLGPGTDSIQPTAPIGMHAVFFARVLVDLILIAALLQAIAIANRNRQQKSLYAVGRIDRLDELVEKDALRKAIRETKVAGATQPDFDLDKLSDPELVDFCHYNMARLRQLRAGSAAGTEYRAFIDKVFARRHQTPDPAIVVAQNIAATHRNELDLFRMFDQAINEHDNRVQLIQLEDIQTLLYELRNTPGMREFKNVLLDTAVQRVSGAPETLLALLTDTGVGPKGGRDMFKYTAKMCAEKSLPIVPKINDPQVISDALRFYKENGNDAFGAAKHDLRTIVSALKARLKDLRPDV